MKELEAVARAIYLASWELDVSQDDMGYKDCMKFDRNRERLDKAAKAVIEAYQAVNGWRDNAQLIKRAKEWRCGVNSPVTKAEAEAYHIIQELVEVICREKVNDCRENMWQLIETAPKDGRKLCLWTPEYGGQPFIDWLTFDGDTGKTSDARPTHWQPLPSPPTTSTKD